MRVLVLIQGPLTDRLSGPEIRGWATARAFAQRHSVSAVADVAAATDREGITVLPRTRRQILAEIRRHDVVVGPVLPPYALLAAARQRCIRVADLYDPVDLELGAAHAWSTRMAVASQRACRRLHLRWADIVVCANEAQMTRTRSDLTEVRRPFDGPDLVTVPMGLPAPAPPSLGHPLRGLFPTIGVDDPLVLWWGSVWRWLDAHTAIDAIARLAAVRPNVRLVITAGKPANSATDRVNGAEDARAHARAIGMLDRHVFFLDDWVPFEERAGYLRDADVGVTLHRDTPEAPLAARARYMDYLWAGLPSVLAEGDEMANRFAQAGAARLVPPGDVGATAQALEGFLSDREGLESARLACRTVAPEFGWERVMSALVERVERLEPRSWVRSQAAAMAAEAACYYGRRAVDRLAVASA